MANDSSVEVIEGNSSPAPTFSYFLEGSSGALAKLTRRWQTLNGESPEEVALFEKLMSAWRSLTKTKTDTLVVGLDYAKILDPWNFGLMDFMLENLASRPPTKEGALDNRVRVSPRQLVRTFRNLRDDPDKRIILGKLLELGQLTQPQDILDALKALSDEDGLQEILADYILHSCTLILDRDNSTFDLRITFNESEIVDALYSTQGNENAQLFLVEALGKLVKRNGQLTPAQMVEALKYTQENPEAQIELTQLLKRLTNKLEPFTTAQILQALQYTQENPEAQIELTQLLKRLTSELEPLSPAQMVEALKCTLENPKAQTVVSELPVSAVANEETFANAIRLTIGTPQAQLGVVGMISPTDDLSFEEVIALLKTNEDNACRDALISNIGPRINTFEDLEKALAQTISLPDAQLIIIDTCNTAPNPEQFAQLIINNAFAPATIEHIKAKIAAAQIGTVAVMERADTRSNYTPDIYRYASDRPCSERKWVTSIDKMGLSSALSGERLLELVNEGNRPNKRTENLGKAAVCILNADQAIEGLRLSHVLQLGVDLPRIQAEFVNKIYEASPNKSHTLQALFYTVDNPELQGLITKAPGSNISQFNAAELLIAISLTAQSPAAQSDLATRLLQKNPDLDTIVIAMRHTRNSGSAQIALLVGFGNTSPSVADLVEVHGYRANEEVRKRVETMIADLTIENSRTNKRQSSATTATQPVATRITPSRRSASRSEM